MYKYIGIALFFVSLVHAIGNGPNEIAANEEEYVNFMRESILQIEDDLTNENSSEEVNKKILHYVLSHTLTCIKERKNRGELSVLNADNLIQHYNRVINAVKSQ